MFSNGDPFTNVDTLVLGQEDMQNEPPAMQPAPPLDQELPLVPRTPESRGPTAGNISRSSPVPYRNSTRRANVSDHPRREEGYYVAFHAVLPGVYPSSYVSLI